jgi:secretion/DNA translocation related CpaE-like protein
MPAALSTEAAAGLPRFGCAGEAGSMTARTGASGPLVVTRDADLREELLRLCAAAAVTPDLVDQAGLAQRDWLEAACVLVGADCAAEVSALALPRRADVSVVAHAPETAQLWRDAVALRAEHVVVVPDSEAALIGRLADTIEGSRRAAVTVAVMGARGGAGASTFAAALGLAAARRGDDALLVDVDAFGGGIELVVGCESAPGLRWPDVATTKGRVSAGALRSALPSAQGLAVLSWRQTDAVGLDRAALAAALSAARRGCDLVVVDVPRQLDPVATEAALAADTMLLVATTDVLSTAGGRRLVRSLGAVCGDIRLVVRRLPRTALLPEQIATSLGVPLAATFPTGRGVSRSIDEGLGPPSRGRLTATCLRVLDDLVVRHGRVG